MSFLTIFVTIIFFLNFIFASIVVFFERRNPSSTWAWLLVLFFIPLLGFVLYLTLGQNLKRKKLFVWEDLKKIGLDDLIQKQKNELQSYNYDPLTKEMENYRDMMYLFLANNNALITNDNNLEIFTDGNDKFKSLFKDIEAAKHHIHLQYYIFRDDDLGTKLIDLLTKKAEEGVEVKILYDEMGSRRIKKRSFNKLKKAGGFVEVFFPSKIPLVNLRINFRNHRKIVVIDGKIAYVGGFNVGDEYLGLVKKFGYWRDTHLRIEGTAVHAAQIRFILDWNQASDRNDIYYDPKYFPEINQTGNIPIQIVTSGPDSQYEHIKNGYIKMISLAKKSIYIQTPYFIPDNSILDALRIAVLSGVEVNIMIPNKPDHIFVYWATLSYIGELLEAGANVYIYDNGFIHAKMIVVDDLAASVGTANIDVRSFKLNFEVNAFIYDSDTAKRLVKVFEQDIEKSRRLTYYQYLQRPLIIRFKESISRLLSPIL
ncbi:cardiolipin synthase [Pallidibacillus pasinlerensis]|uniref:Cardiolipin synthase n=1 Tax=Pallidibacillus pasinlerensis TaxID=2703818 RepID=A0ABX0A5Y0_9BACI|nr:cardiolipin synthase [Pallidibacillus pasinlerensis]NCU18856.1 cardiolipin synthase [Pallidibacillus pasinlerensis]